MFIFFLCVLDIEQYFHFDICIIFEELCFKFFLDQLAFLVMYTDP